MRRGARETGGVVWIEIEDHPALRSPLLDKEGMGEVESFATADGGRRDDSPLRFDSADVAPGPQCPTPGAPFSAKR